MTEQIIIHDKNELKKYRTDILHNLEDSVTLLKQILESKDTLSVFKILKFDKSAVEPLTGNHENLIEVLNQTHTYLISIMAVEYLYEKYPNQAFVINWGNIPGYDIESIDGTIIAECFAATSYKSNGKLTADLKRLVTNTTALYKYEFFYDKEFTENHYAYYEDRYPNIEIVKFYDIC